MLTAKRRNKWMGLLFILLLLLGSAGCSRAEKGTETGETAYEAEPISSNNETEADDIPETNRTEESEPQDSNAQTDDSDSADIPEIVLTKAEKLPYPQQIAKHCVSAIGGNTTIWLLDDSTEFCIQRYLTDYNQSEYYTGTLTLPDGYDSPSVFRIARGGGSGEIDITVSAVHEDDTVYLNYCFNFTNDNFLPNRVTVLSELQLQHLLESVSNGAYKGEKLSDYRNENPGDNLFYEGYTVAYTIPYPYYDGETFDFHIHLPQLGDGSDAANEWNQGIFDNYSVKFGDYLRETANGNNREFFANITWDTVTTGDVITIYIIDATGILNSGAAGMTYDIYHYDTAQKKFLSTDEFLAYYAEGQFADYTVADIVKFMNEHSFTTDELGNPYPLTEENILGVIPSVFGEGKFDVVYQGYVVEGRFATRMLFSPYPVYNHQYTYRLTYHDYVDCEDKEIYGTPAGYRLLINQRVIGEYDTGYYVDCLFVEDIAEAPESYSLSENGGYYTPIQEDPYGNMCIVVDHETDRGHLNSWIPFDMPQTAQDYYWGVHNKYFSYDRILDGSNYQVNKDIAAQVAAVLDAYRNGKDPNNLFPASATEYTPYPMETIRENPTADEIGEILKNTSVGENGIINFKMDIGDGWTMALPIGIGGFGDSAQAYFTGVYFAHGTPKNTIKLPENFVFPVTDGSTSTTNLDKAVRSAILGGEQAVAHTKTYTSFQNLLDGKCKLIFATPLSDSQLQTMQNIGFRHEAEPVAGEGFVFVVNKDNPVDTLTVEQIKGIYSGEITNWKEVGGNDAQIIAYQRNADSGSQNYMISFMGDTPLMQPITEQTPASMSGILDVIAGYDNGIDAIGYSVYAYSDGMYENISEIKYIKVNGVEPSLTTLADGTYPLLGYNYAVFSAEEPEDSHVRTLVKWIQSDEGQQVIADAGYIPYRKVEGLTLPEATTKTLYTAVGTSGVMKPEEMADYYYQCNSVPKSFKTEGLNEAVAAFIADAKAELAMLDMEEMQNFVRSRFPWGYASEDIVVRKTLINGYLSVVVGLWYNEGAQDSPDYYYDVRAAVFDIYTGKQLEFSDLFFDGEDFVPLLNQYLADKAVSPYSTFGATHDMLSSFTGLYEGEFTFTADSIIFNRNTCFADGVVLSLDGLLEYMATSVPRDMAGYVDASVPVYKKIRYMSASEYAEEKNGITIWYLEKENNLLSEEVCDRVNTFIDSVYNEYFTSEKLLASAQKIDSAYDRVTIGPFPDFHVNLYGKRFIEVRGANLAFPLKMGEESYGIDYTVVQGHYNSFYFAYYFSALTGEELRMGDLFHDGWENEATYSVFDEEYEQWIAYTKAVDVSTCKILSISDYVNAPYNKGDMSDLEIPVTVYVSTENGDRIAVSVPREYILN